MSADKKLSDCLDVHALNPLLTKILWVLDHLTTEQKDRFTASEIANFLIEKVGFSTSRQAVRLALMRESKLTNHNKVGFKLMKVGKDKLSEFMHENSVILIESGKPFSAKNITLKEVFSQIGGTLRICDPYVDLNTLDIILKSVDKKTKVCILTSRIIDKPVGVVGRHLADLKSEGFDIEIRIYSKSELHDRYLMDDQFFWLSGNSQNHLGQKESFIVRLGEDIRQNMLEAFNRRWKVSTSVTAPTP